MRNIVRLVIAIFLCATPAYAQDRSTTGSITGTVTDATGAAVQNAAVTVTGQTLPSPRTATTGDEGTFTFDNLIPGL